MLTSSLTFLDHTRLHTCLYTMDGSTVLIRKREGEGFQSPTKFISMKRNISTFSITNEINPCFSE